MEGCFMFQWGGGVVFQMGGGFILKWGVRPMPMGRDIDFDGGFCSMGDVPPCPPPL